MIRRESGPESFEITQSADEESCADQQEQRESDLCSNKQLAQEHTRTLYFEHNEGKILWSTYLDTFFIEGAVRQPDHDYIRAYLSSQPTSQRTLYKGISGVPPGHFVRFRGDRKICTTHWHCAAKSKVRYKGDLAYE